VATTQKPGRQTRSNGLIRPAGLVRPGIADAPLPTVEIDPRTVYDFLTSACPECGELSDLLPEDRAWLEKARAEVAGQLGPDLFATECMEFVFELGRIAVLRPEIKTASDFVAAVDAMTDQELLDTMLAELMDSPDFGDLARKALTGDAAAWEDLKSQLHSYKGRFVLDGSISALPQASRTVLKTWLPKFEQIEDRVAKMLARDVAARSMDEAERDPIGFVERATNGIRINPERQLRRVRLAPSYFGRPYNSLTRIGGIQLICYPIDDAAVGSSSRTIPPATTIRLYRALGDETRLRILRLLAEQDRYMTELANELDLSKPTISHHLAQLLPRAVTPMKPTSCPSATSC
jgi:hypothetical protein